MKDMSSVVSWLVGTRETMADTCSSQDPKAFRSQACTSVGRGIGGGIIAPRDGTAADRNLSVLSPQPHPPVIRWIDLSPVTHPSSLGERVLVLAWEVVVIACPEALILASACS
jgi:hypothetical protein